MILILVDPPKLNCNPSFERLRENNTLNFARVIEIPQNIVKPFLLKLVTTTILLDYFLVSFSSLQCDIWQSTVFIGITCIAIKSQSETMQRTEIGTWERQN